jgi:hypothetical protein
MRSIPMSEYSVHHMLNALTDQYCEVPSRMLKYSLQCGDHGWYVLWFNNPPKKLCRDCLELPEYRFTMMKKAMKHYGLTNRDVKNTPSLKGKAITKYAYFKLRIFLGKALVMPDVSSPIRLLLNSDSWKRPLERKGKRWMSCHTRYQKTTISLGLSLFRNHLIREAG